MRRSLTARLLPLAFLVLPAAAARAQDTPPDPLESATVRIGPVGLTPIIVVRDIGRDSNVFNEATDAKQDFTATISPRLDAVVHAGPMLVTYTTTSDYVYYKKYTSERGVNLGSSVRADFGFGPIRPFVSAAGVNSRERLNREIDVRARHRDVSYAGGVRVQIAEALFATVSARQSRTRFDADAPEFRGVKLSDTLNATSEAIDAGAGVALTPLTTLQVIVTTQRDRFELTPLRDSDTLRITPTVTFSPLAILGGTASFGYRKFTPKSSLVPPFKGFVSSLTLATTMLERHRLDAAFGRDLQYSAEESASVYLETGGQGTWTWLIAGPFDVRVSGGRARLHYRSPDLTVAADDDIASNYGVSLGYRVKEKLRVGLNADWRQRDSERGADRAYRNRKIYANLTWGRK